MPHKLDSAAMQAYEAFADRAFGLQGLDSAVSLRYGWEASVQPEPTISGGSAGPSFVPPSV